MSIKIKRLPRAIPWTEEHHMFREVTRNFFEKEVAPYSEEWEKNGQVSRDVWARAGELGLICPSFPEEYGGAGGDFLYNVIVMMKEGLPGILQRLVAKLL